MSYQDILSSNCLWCALQILCLLIISVLLSRDFGCFQLYSRNVSASRDGPVCDVRVCVYECMFEYEYLLITRSAVGAVGISCCCRFWHFCVASLCPKRLHIEQMVPKGTMQVLVCQRTASAKSWCISVHTHACRNVSTRIQTTPVTRARRDGFLNDVTDSVIRRFYPHFISKPNKAKATGVDCRFQVDATKKPGCLVVLDKRN